MDGESIIIPGLGEGAARFREELPKTKAFKNNFIINHLFDEYLQGINLNPLLPELLHPGRRNIGKHSNHLDQELEGFILKLKMSNSEALNLVSQCLR